MGIVARVRWDETSSAPLQSRPGVARYYLVAILSSRLLPDGTGPASSAPETAVPGRATQTWFGFGVRRWQPRRPVVL